MLAAVMLCPGPSDKAKPPGGTLDGYIGEYILWLRTKEAISSARQRPCKHVADSVGDILPNPIPPTYL
jgi:hypothetical protein